MLAQANHAEASCGHRDFLVCAAVGIPLLVLGAFSASILLGTSLIDSLVISGSGISGVAFTVVLIVWLRDRGTAGPVLLDCGGPAAEYSCRLAVAVLLLGALVMISTGRSRMSQTLIVLNALIGSGLLISHTFSRLQVCERGIWCYGSLLKWSRITSCEWDRESDATSRIRFRTWLPWYGGVILSMLSEHKTAMTELLATHSSAAGVSPP